MNEENIIDIISRADTSGLEAAEGAVREYGAAVQEMDQNWSGAGPLEAAKSHDELAESLRQLAEEQGRSIEVITGHEAALAEATTTVRGYSAALDEMDQNWSGAGPLQAAESHDALAESLRQLELEQRRSIEVITSHDAAMASNAASAEELGLRMGQTVTGPAGEFVEFMERGAEETRGFAVEMTDAGPRVRAVGDAVEEVGPKVRDVSEAVEEQGGLWSRLTAFIDEHAVTGAAALGAFAGSAVAYALQVGDAWKDATNAIVIGTGAMGDVMAGLEADLGAITVGVVQGAAAVGPVVADLNTRLGLTGEALQTAATYALNYARVHGGDAVDATTKFSQALTVLELGADQLPVLMDQVTRASQLGGVGVDQLVDALVRGGSQLMDFGFSIEEQLAIFARFEQAGIRPTQIVMNLNMAMGRLAAEGVTDLTGAFNDWIQRIGEAQSPAEALNVALELLERRTARNFVTAVRSGAFAMEEWVSEIQNAGGAVEYLGEETLTLGDKIRRGLGVLEPILGPIMDTFAGATSWMGNWIHAIGPVIGGFLGMQMPTILGYFDLLMVKGRAALSAIATGFASAVTGGMSFATAAPIIGRAFHLMLGPLGLATLALTAFFAVLDDWGGVGTWFDENISQPIGRGVDRIAMHLGSQRTELFQMANDYNVSFETVRTAVDRHMRSTGDTFDESVRAVRDGYNRWYLAGAEHRTQMGQIHTDLADFYSEDTRAFVLENDRKLAAQMEWGRDMAAGYRLYADAVRREAREAAEARQRDQAEWFASEASRPDDLSGFADAIASAERAGWRVAREQRLAALEQQRADLADSVSAYNDWRDRVTAVFDSLVSSIVGRESELNKALGNLEEIFGDLVPESLYDEIDLTGLLPQQQIDLLAERVRQLDQIDTSGWGAGQIAVLDWVREQFQNSVVRLSEDLDAHAIRLGVDVDKLVDVFRRLTEEQGFDVEGAFREIERQVNAGLLGVEIKPDIALNPTFTRPITPTSKPPLLSVLENIAATEGMTVAQLAEGTGLKVDIPLEVVANQAREIDFSAAVAGAGAGIVATVSSEMQAAAPEAASAASVVGDAIAGILAIRSEPSNPASPLAGITAWGPNMVTTIATGVMAAAPLMMVAGTYTAAQYSVGIELGRPAAESAAATIVTSVNAVFAAGSLLSFIWGLRTGEAYAAGLSAAGPSAANAARNVQNAARVPLYASSPPGPESPLHEIQVWARRTMEAYGEGFTDAESVVVGNVRGVLRSVASEFNGGGEAMPVGTWTRGESSIPHGMMSESRAVELLADIANNSRLQNAQLAKLAADDPDAAGPLAARGMLEVLQTMER